jgi:hypothetical protein
MKTINESSLSRVQNFVTNYDCAIITAFRDTIKPGLCANDYSAYPTEFMDGQPIPKEIKRECNRELKATLLSLGYGVTRVDGSYIENYNSEAAKEVREESYFVVNLTNSTKFLNDIIDFGEIYCQDAVILIPKGGKRSMLYGTNNASFPGYHNSIKLGEFRGGKESEFMTRVGNRPFVLESYSSLPRLERMACKKISDNFLSKLYRKHDNKI